MEGGREGGRSVGGGVDETLDGVAVVEEREEEGGRDGEG
jgi:hypothetical protein